MSKVFAVNFSSKDYDKAEELGELVFMTKGVLDLRKHEQHKKSLEGYIKNSDPEDFLMFSGQNLICSIALSLWLQKHPSCKVLLWDGIRKNYEVYEISR